VERNQQKLIRRKKKDFSSGRRNKRALSRFSFDGLVIKNSINGIALDGDKVTVGAGTLFTNLVDYCVNNSLSGLQWAGGMPGTVGGAVRGNAGAFGGETKDNVLQVYSINLESLGEITRIGKSVNFHIVTVFLKRKQAVMR